MAEVQRLKDEDEANPKNILKKVLLKATKLELVDDSTCEVLWRNIEVRFLIDAEAAHRASRVAHRTIGV